MNTSTLIVQIVSVPQHIVFPGKLSLVKMQVEFTKTKKGKRICGQFETSIWGSLADHLLEYYGPGDYIIIEGILSFRKRKGGNPYQKDTKFAVTNFYPFLLVEDQLDFEEEVKLGETAKGRQETKVEEEKESLFAKEEKVENN